VLGLEIMWALLMAIWMVGLKVSAMEENSDMMMGQPMEHLSVKKKEKNLDPVKERLIGALKEKLMEVKSENLRGASMEQRLDFVSLLDGHCDQGKVQKRGLL